MRDYWASFGESPTFFFASLPRHHLDRDFDHASPPPAVDPPFAALGHERIEREVGGLDAPRFLQRVDVFVAALDLLLLAFDEDVLELLHALRLAAAAAHEARRQALHAAGSEQARGNAEVGMPAAPSNTHPSSCTYLHLL